MSYFCYQANDTDCGFASLKMLLATLSKNKDYLNLKKGEKRSDFTFFDLIEIAKEHGLTLKPYKYSLSEVNEIKTPFLALLEHNHLVMVKAYRNGRYVIYDPSEGIYTLKPSAFDKVWNGLTLEVVEYKKQEYHCKRNLVMPIRFSLISILISVISLVSILVGFFFVKDDAYFFIPIIFLSLFSISELVDNWYLIKEINIFDKKYLPIFFEKKNDDLMAQYKDYLEFKKDYFGFARKFYGACMVAIVVLVVLIINDPINSIVCLSLILLCLLEKILFKRKDDEIVKNIGENEKLLIKHDNQNLVSDLIMINQSSNSFALNISIRKCINTFIIIVLSFTMMMIAQTTSVNFVLFHFGVFYIFFNNIDVVITMGEKKKDYDLSKARFLDVCNL